MRVQHNATNFAWIIVVTRIFVGLFVVVIFYVSSFFIAFSFSSYFLVKGAAQRFSDAYFDALTRGTRYADRMPIGTLDVIRTVTGDTMRQFYAKRYHPQLMAVRVCVVHGACHHPSDTPE